MAENERTKSYLQAILDMGSKSTWSLLKGGGDVEDAGVAADGNEGGAGGEGGVGAEEEDGDVDRWVF